MLECTTVSAFYFVCGSKSFLSLLMVNVSPTCIDQEKSKLDWDGFKHEEGISEELTTHNRGKEGYVNNKLCIMAKDKSNSSKNKTRL